MGDWLINVLIDWWLIYWMTVCIGILMTKFRQFNIWTKTFRASSPVGDIMFLIDRCHSEHAASPHVPGGHGVASDPSPSEHSSWELSTTTRQPLHLEEGVPRCHGEVRMEGGKEGDEGLELLSVLLLKQENFQLGTGEMSSILADCVDLFHCSPCFFSWKFCRERESEREREISTHKREEECSSQLQLTREIWMVQNRAGQDLVYRNADV